MAMLLWNSTEKGRFVPGTGPILSPGRGPICDPGTVPVCPRHRPAENVYVGLPRKQKIAVNKFWVQESEIGEEHRQFWT